ncbi:4Fe-4S binding protein [Geothermobacter hydrogeniphilus]|uniref:4Fe-4S binding protein n=1 Tax=Geothermobacter hydrogeniphilus TaxID=1969733 RepID=A0A2K2HA09_9BACT|nr:4Fe-4S binding protein [Geothermobacter hydrogeniphilus]PNU20101.1 4Fe-4S binding protein [Geothermobacter hydrogeniphilus]
MTSILRKTTALRLLVQWAFLGWCLFLGIQFSLFVEHYRSFGRTPDYLRPPGVEGFLPIGALVSLKNWLVNGQFDTIHPAALVLLLTFFTMSLLAKKSFCSWLCPVGTVEEGLWRLGRKLCGRNFTIWRWLDIPLRALKYALLLFFFKLIIIDMPAAVLQGFLASPYWAVADVRMLHFFTGFSPLSLGVILLLAVLSVFYQNFWCRYLCPYGALVGLLSMLSPLKIRRSDEHCVHCGACTRACPAQLPVAEKTAIRSPECTACLGCVSSCPEAVALGIRLPFLQRAIPGWGFGLLVLVLFFTGVAAGMLSGHWHTSLTPEDFQRLIPMAERFGH